MTNRATHLALAAGAGYLLGRRRNLRVVLALGAAVAAGRLSGGSGGLLRRGAKTLGGSAELSNLAGLGAPLAAATKAAVTSAVTRRIDSVSDGLRDRAEALRGQRRADGDEQGAPARSRKRDAQAGPPRRRPAEHDTDSDEFARAEDLDEDALEPNDLEDDQDENEADDEDGIEDPDPDEDDDADSDDDADDDEDSDDEFDEVDEEPQRATPRLPASRRAPARQAAKPAAAPVRRRGR